MSNSTVVWSRVGRNIAASTLALFAVGLVSVQAEDVEKPWDRSVALGLAITTGNSDSVQVNAGIKGEKIWKKDELRLGLDGTYGKNDGAVATELLHGVIQYKHLITPRFYCTGLADGIHDAVANIEYRVEVGPALGYYFIKSDTTKLSGEAGLAYVFEKRDVLHSHQPAPAPTNSLYITSEEHSYLAARVGERFDHKINDHAKVWQQTEWLPQVDDVNNYVLSSEAGVETALTKALSLRVVGTHRYYNYTPDKRRHYDATIVSAIAYKF